jgi:hypothetical protein
MLQVLKRLLFSSNRTSSPRKFRPSLEGLEERLNLSPPPPVLGTTYEWIGGPSTSGTTRG